MPLSKIQAFFARGQNPKWPPLPFWKLSFEREHQIMYSTFSGRSITRILILTLVWHYGVIFTQKSKMAANTHQLFIISYNFLQFQPMIGMFTFAKIMAPYRIFFSFYGCQSLQILNQPKQPRENSSRLERPASQVYRKGRWIIRLFRIHVFNPWFFTYMLWKDIECHRTPSYLFRIPLPW